MNCLFLGRGPIAEQCFLKLFRTENLYVPVVVSNHNFYRKNEVYINHFIPNDQRREEDILLALEKHCINVVLSIQHPWILSGKVLDVVSGVAFNLHNAKLPEYQGFHSIAHALLNGDKEYTTTIHWMDINVDEGDIAYEEVVGIEEDETAKSLYEKSQTAAQRNFEKLLGDLSVGLTPPRYKNGGVSHFYSREDIDKDRTIRDITNKVEVDRKARAYYIPPYRPANFIIGQKLYNVLPGGMCQ